MDAIKLTPKPYSRPDNEIRQIIVSYVYNNARLDFSDDHDGSKYEAFKRVFQGICDRREFLDEEHAMIWWDWGTREGFTII